MRNGEGGTVPSYNLQLLTDTAQGMIVNVDATTEGIDHHQLVPTLERCEQTLGRLPQQVVADGNHTHHASVAAAGDCGVDFYVAGELEGRQTRCAWPQGRVSGERLPTSGMASLVRRDRP